MEEKTKSGNTSNKKVLFPYSILSITVQHFLELSVIKRPNVMLWISLMSISSKQSAYVLYDIWSPNSLVIILFPK